MAREIRDIQAEMYETKANEIVLSPLNSQSKTSVWRLLIYIIAYAIYNLEVLFDKHRINIEDILKKQQHHTALWYRNKALNFQYGFDLITESDEYNNTGVAEDDINNSKIIKYCAVTEAESESRLIIKIASEQEGVLAPISPTQNDAFTTYVSKIKDAGVRVTIINLPPDRLKLKMRIVRNPLLIDENGMNRKTGEIPVNNTIKEFLKLLPFNGELSLQKLEATILQVDGVEDLALDIAESSWIDTEANGNGNYGGMSSIDISKVPVSGYFTINLENDNEYKSLITYV